MRNARWFSSILIAFELTTLVVSLIASPAFAQDTVQLQIQSATNVRSKDENQRNVLVHEYTLPAGSVIEIPKKELEKPIFMKFWDALTGQEQNKAPFVKNIRLISAPGYTKSDIKEFNATNEDYDLFMSRNKLADSDKVSESDASESLRMHHETDIRRKHNMALSKGGKNDNAQSRAMLDRISQANKSAAVAGRGQEHCEACDSGFAQRWLRAGVPARALQKALTYYKAHRNTFRNQRYITINDFSSNSGEKRMFILDMTNGAIEKHYVAHGSPNRGADNGNTPGFSNSAKSNKTPRGFLRTGELYRGKHGTSLRLDGLEAQNSNTRRRAVVIHKADYASERFVRAYGKTGRSWGCLAVDPHDITSLINKIKGGSLVFNYGGE